MSAWTRAAMALLLGVVWPLGSEAEEVAVLPVGWTIKSCDSCPTKDCPSVSPPPTTTPPSSPGAVAPTPSTTTTPPAPTPPAPTPPAPTPPAPDAPAPDAPQAPTAAGSELNQALDLSSPLDTVASNESLAVNMIGDFFGGPSTTISGSIPGFLNGPFSVTFVDASYGEISGGQSTYVHNLGSPVLVTVPGVGTLGPFPHNYPGATDPLYQTGPAPPPGTLSPLETTQDTLDTVNSQLKTATQPGGSAFVYAQGLIGLKVPGAALQSLSATISPGGTVAAGSTPGTGNLTYSGQVNSSLLIPVFIALPSGARPGATIGVMKVSENNSVLPRDRFIFNYNFFGGVPLTAAGININRWTPGFEKTFFNGRTSFEMLFPFASTIDNVQTVNGGISTGRVQFGNMRMLAKALVWNRPGIAIGGGIGVEVPTADDLGARLADGTTLLAIQNQAVHLQPYVGALVTPNDRLFAQSFLQVNVDASGNPVLANPTLSGLQSVGRVYSQPLMLFDTQFGYWLFQNRPSIFRSLAGIFEVHYNASLGGGLDFVAAEGFRVNNLLGSFNIVNLTLGGMFQLGERTQAQVGVVTPVTGDRGFDYEFAAYLNYYFGRRYRGPTPTLF